MAARWDNPRIPYKGWAVISYEDIRKDTAAFVWKNRMSVTAGTWTEFLQKVMTGRLPGRRDGLHVL